MTNASQPQPLLVVDHVTSGYSAPVIRDVSFTVGSGELMAVIGANGAGKSTLLKAISGILPKQSGRVAFDGDDITGLPGYDVVSRGLLHVAEGHRIFRDMTVDENLQVPLWGTRLGRELEEQRRQRVFDLFPILHTRLHARAGVLSGGEQQMLAIGQALMKDPRLLMLDEPSLGLAPVIIDTVFEVIRRLNNSGMTIVLVEQMVERALEVADRACLIQGGAVVAVGTPDTLRQSNAVRRAYLGAAAGER